MSDRDERREEEWRGRNARMDEELEKRRPLRERLGSAFQRSKQAFGAAYERVKPKPEPKRTYSKEDLDTARRELRVLRTQKQIRETRQKISELDRGERREKFRKSPGGRVAGWWAGAQGFMPESEAQSLLGLAPPKRREKPKRKPGSNISITVNVPRSDRGAGGRKRRR